MNTGKRGVSPVIATVLLILIAVVLAAIILLWIRAFVGEKIQKDLGNNEPQAIENFCDKIQFSADITADSGSVNVSIENKGDVPIYGVEVRKKGAFSVKKVGQAISEMGSGVTSGDTANLCVQKIGEQGCGTFTSDLATGDTVTLAPILLGTTQNGGNFKSYTCDDKFGVDATVG